MFNLKFISEQGSKNLKEFKYRPGMYTYCDNMMQPFWNWVVTLIPEVRLFTMLILSAVGCTKLDHFNRPRLGLFVHWCIRAI